jgi:hypothetical protein
MQEIILNLHIHTNYSDGNLPHDEVAKAAIRCGLNAILITDHNVRPEGLQRYIHDDGKKVLVMIGEEIHNQDRQPQKSHLLAFGADRDLASFAYDPQLLIQKVNQAGGISFLAHPYDPALPAFSEDNISWDDWEVKGYTGIELWNGFSELKVHVHNKLQAIFFAFNPQFIAHQPPAQTLKIWDKLLSQGNKVVAIGGSDAHATRHYLGPISRIIFPYEFHFSAINTHVLLDSPLIGNAETDSRSILGALRKGHCFVGYDLPASSRGFRFWTENGKSETKMGDEIKLKRVLNLKIQLPSPAECHLLKDGEMIKQWKGETEIQTALEKTGVYRVECFRNYLGKKRGWIFSNPIYIR